jgi:ABC-2 type transport system permease protein
MCWYRIRALMLRYFFLYSKSTFRVLDIFFWPFMDLLVWGFVSMYLLKMGGGVPASITFLIGAIIFWDILYRAQQAVTVSFLEDVWSRNLLNIFVAPVRISEFVAATYIVGMIQAIIVLLMMSLLAQWFYSFNILTIGLALMPFFVNLLLMGWMIGLVTTALILRFGQSAEVLAWAVPFLVQPLAAVFYPLDVLPPWLQVVSNAIPATHVFEGMRQVLKGGGLSVYHLVSAFALNAIYLVAGGLFFRFMFDKARKLGLLNKLGT